MVILRVRVKVPFQGAEPFLYVYKGSFKGVS